MSAGGQWWGGRGTRHRVMARGGASLGAGPQGGAQVQVQCHGCRGLCLSLVGHQNFAGSCLN